MLHFATAQLSILDARTRKDSFRRLAVAAIATCLLFWGVIQSVSLVQQVNDEYSAKGVPALPNSDFSLFYSGAHTIVSRNRDDLYDKPSMVRRMLVTRGYDAEQLPADLNADSAQYTWYRYYNPPAYLLALSPLVLLDLHAAYLVAVAIGVLTTVALAGALGYILRWRQPQTLLLLLGLFAFSPVYYTIGNTQPTTLIALCLATGYLALRNQRHMLAGLLLSLCGIKPQCAISAVTALRWGQRAIPGFIVSGFLLLLVPFALLGPSALLDYAHLVLNRGGADLSDNRLSLAVLSWSGFFHALTGEPQVVLWLIASGLTLMTYLVILLKGGREEGIAAAVLAAVLIVPHSHPQDWLLVAPAAALLLSLPARRPGQWGVYAGLAAVFLGANVWPPAFDSAVASGRAIYWVTLAAAFLLAWLAVQTLRGTKQTEI